MELNKDFKEFVKLLNDNQVEYQTIINFIDFSSLLKAKEIANRPKDKIDIQELKKLLAQLSELVGLLNQYT